MEKEIRNIGILAHVDAGKTTITENFLFLSGLTRQKGSVDNGSAITDNLKIERQRGISVRSACVSFEWQNSIINLIDTPGHTDFSSEVERVLRILDGAIIIISAVEGIQSHTVTLIETLREMDIPFIIFVNKIDRAGADFENVIKGIKKDLSLLPVPVIAAFGEATTDTNIFNYWLEELPEEYSSIDENIIESIIELDDVLMIRFLDGESISRNDIWQSAKESIQARKLIPVLSGIAKNSLGIKELLDAIISFLPAAPLSKEKPLSALIYKIDHDKLLGRIAHIRVFEGAIHSKDTVFIQRFDEKRKIGLTKKIYLHRFEDIESIESGNIGLITGLSDIIAGDVIGNSGIIPKSRVLHSPVMTVQVKPKKSADYNKLSYALSILESENPSLSLKWYKESQEFHIKIVGPMQIEILENEIWERFGVESSFDKPIIIYKERPKKKAEGFVRYWMPKPCWAIMTFMVEPGELGSGISYNSKVRQSDIHLKYQNEVERTIPRSLKQGIKGWEVTDIKITLLSGEDHVMHSNPGDFILATPMGIMKALKTSGTEFLEPMLSFKIKAPEEYLGKIAGDLTKMRARFANPKIENGFFSLSGIVPAATSLDYSIKLSSLTSGKGRINLRLNGYEPCSDENGITRDFKGVNPLDEAKWILHQRGAYKADERVR